MTWVPNFRNHRGGDLPSSFAPLIFFPFHSFMPSPFPLSPFRFSAFSSPPLYSPPINPARGPWELVTSVVAGIMFVFLRFLLSPCLNAGGGENRSVTPTGFLRRVWWPPSPSYGVGTHDQLYQTAQLLLSTFHASSAQSSRHFRQSSRLTTFTNQHPTHELVAWQLTDLLQYTTHTRTHTDWNLST